MIAIERVYEKVRRHGDDLIRTIKRSLVLLAVLGGLFGGMLIAVAFTAGLVIGAHL